jgi:hypothetical protein
VSGPETTEPYWSRDAGDVSASLGSGRKGLTAARAAERLAVVGLLIGYLGGGINDAASTVAWASGVVTRACRC